MQKEHGDPSEGYSPGGVVLVLCPANTFTETGVILPLSKAASWELCSKAPRLARERRWDQKALYPGCLTTERSDIFLFEKRGKARQSEIRAGSVLGHVTKRIPVSRAETSPPGRGPVRVA